MRARRPLSTTDVALGGGTAALAVAAMAVDHLMGDDPGLEDPPAFLISVGVSLAVALVVFGRVVPRSSADRAPLRALALAVLTVVSLPLAFLGLPFPLAGGAVALGLRGRGSGSGLATAVLAVGVTVLAFLTVGYSLMAVDKLA